MNTSKLHFDNVSDKWEKLEKDSIYYMWSELKQIHMIRNLENSKVLDVGTGIGTMAVQACLHGADEVVGIDVSESMVQKANKSALDAKCSQKSMFTVMDAKKMLFENNRFDIVTCSAVAEIEPELHRVLSEIRRVLKPGGNLYLLLIQNTFFNRVWTKTMMFINKKPEWEPRYRYLRTEDEIVSILPPHMHIIKKYYFGYTAFNPLFAFPFVKKALLPFSLNYLEPALNTFFSVSNMLQRLFANSTFLVIRKDLNERNVQTYRSLSGS